MQYDSDIYTDVETESLNNVAAERVFKVKTFAEKPNLEVAKAFLESGDFLWNSGMFIFRTDTMIEEIKNYMPELHKSLNRLSDNILSTTFPKILEDEYSKLKSISMDYGVMEKSEKSLYYQKSFWME
ncbi:MAG: hypothetical protein IPM38_04735 [Ignavibacteria bacterium]|nr:hypothetical protein [Ignavibacteria bacterium]